MTVKMRASNYQLAFKDGKDGSLLIRNINDLYTNIGYTEILSYSSKKMGKAFFL